MKTKRKIGIMLLFSSLLVLLPMDIASAFEEKTLVVTAYYSPKPNQVRYITGSYEGDKRLNGNGTNGADGTEVYRGMLAAPRTYEFGTKVYIPGLGIGTVHDRGGAIKAYENHDRIDVWMGEGDEGLQRALEWGSRTVEGKVYEPGTELADSIFFAEVVVPELVKEEIVEHMFAVNLDIGDEGEEVLEIQKALVELGYLSEDDLTGVYDEMTVAAVYLLQEKYEVVSSEDDYGAGYFGKKTRSTLESAVIALRSDEEVEEEEEVLHASAGEVEEEEKDESENELFASDLKVGDSGGEVKKLQEFLKNEGYFEGEAGGYYGSLTRDAVAEYQADKGIDDSNGYFGELTRCYINDSMKEDKLGIQVLAGLAGEYVPINVLTARINGRSLSLGASGEAVSTLQEILVRLEYLDEKPTGYFGENTEEALIAFQIEHDVIEDEDSYGAGVFGPMTSQTINQIAL